MEAHFELEDELGLDEDRAPIPSFVVRTHGKRRIQVWGNEGPWKVEVDDDSVATAHVVRRVGRTADIEIKGIEEGTCELHAYHGARMSARLLVRVVDPHEVSVNFHFFTAGPSKTTLTRSHAVKLLDELNKIYEPQSYIKWRLHMMDPIRDDALMAIDFATTSQSGAAEKSIWAKLTAYLAKEYPAKMQRNVFCVRKWGARDRWKCQNGACEWRNVMGTNPIGGNIAIVESTFANAGSRLPQLLAHELGHSLGLKHDEVHAKNLMYPSMNVEYIKIRQWQAYKMGQIF